MKCQCDPNETIKVLNKGYPTSNKSAVIEMRDTVTGDRVRVSLNTKKTRKLIKQLETSLGK